VSCIEQNNAIGIKAVYVLEFLTERFERLDEEEKIKTIIHELMHIPKSFGGGFVHHNFVTERTVNKVYQEYKKRKDEKSSGINPADSFYN
jgi:predicted metallopeptidase